MKTWVFLAACVAAGLVSSRGAPPARPAPAKERQAVANVTNRFTLRGMHCEGCAKGISGELKQLDGVVRVEVSYPKKLAIVAHDTNRVDVAAVIAAIKEAGFEAEVLRARAQRP
ncbi:MAG: heavy-metal-associated domain-containing protein [Verrucomicrobiales bacterium]|nr:heavy-metal-associated domain-containing protein [Verrucomicrobiales bacterium]